MKIMVILSRAMCMFRSTLSSSGPYRYPARPEAGFYLYNYLKFYEVKYWYMKCVDSQNWKNKHVLWNLSAEVKISSSHVKKCCVWTVKITKVNVFDSDVIGKRNKQMKKMPTKRHFLGIGVELTTPAVMSGIRKWMARKRMNLHYRRTVGQCGARSRLGLWRYGPRTPSHLNNTSEQHGDIS